MDQAIHLLFVGGELSSLQTLAGLLDSRDYTVSIAATFAHAREILLQHPIELVVIGVVYTPADEEHGLEFARWLKLSGYAYADIIFMGSDPYPAKLFRESSMREFSALEYLDTPVPTHRWLAIFEAYQNGTLFSSTPIHHPSSPSPEALPKDLAAPDSHVYAQEPLPPLSDPPTQQLRLEDLYEEPDPPTLMVKNPYFLTTPEVSKESGFSEHNEQPTVLIDHTAYLTELDELDAQDIVEDPGPYEMEDPGPYEMEESGPYEMEELGLFAMEEAPATQLIPRSAYDVPVNEDTDLLPGRPSQPLSKPPIVVRRSSRQDVPSVLRQVMRSKPQAIASDAHHDYQIGQPSTEEEPSDAEMSFNLGLQFIQKQMPTEALAAFTRAVEIDPKPAYRAYYASTVAMVFADDAAQLEHVEEILLEVTEEAPSIEQVHLLLGRFYCSYRQYSEALQVYRKALRHDSKFSDVLDEYERLQEQMMR